MDYYNTFLTYIVDDDYDRSYPAPEMQLLWRLDDLQDRLEELIANDAPYRDEDIFLDDDLNYALPDDLWDICKVERAIELLQKDYLTFEGVEEFINNAKC